MVPSSPSFQREGYLNEPFRLFHLADSAGQEHELHYHEFDKILFFIRGSVDYLIEGTAYTLQPGDILLIRHHLIHNAVIDTDKCYERVILYLDPAFLRSRSTAKSDLALCLDSARHTGSFLVHFPEEQTRSLMDLITSLEQTLTDPHFGADVLAQSRLTELLIRLNRLCPSPGSPSEQPQRYDPRFVSVLSYINEHLAQPLSVEHLASLCYLSKYHFMRRFKLLTGYSVHAYVRQKRLLVAAEMIRSGTAPTLAADRCGFGDYSTFQRAFKQAFGVTPKDF